MVLTFGVIAEGRTDQFVIRNILRGYFQDDEEPAVNFVQPLPAISGSPTAPGGWTLVFSSLERGDHQKALQFNDYLVIQIDADVQDQFGVPRQKGGRDVPIPTRIDDIIARLVAVIEDEFYQACKDRILFAIAVDTIECWLLPLLYSNKKKAEKTKGCLNAANAAIRKSDRKGGLSAGNTKKFPEAYDLASRDYTKRKKLMEHRDRNPSLGLFIKQLDALRSRLTAGDPATTQEQADVLPDDV